MRIGLLTGRGDCPGLNAVIRAVVRKGVDAYGDDVIGFRDGWRGVLEDSFEELTVESTRGILPRGGTILRSSRTNPYKRDDGPRKVRETLSRHDLDGLIAIGVRTRWVSPTDCMARVCTLSGYRRRSITISGPPESGGLRAPRRASPRLRIADQVRVGTVSPSRAPDSRARPPRISQPGTGTARQSPASTVARGSSRRSTTPHRSCRASTHNPPSAERGWPVGHEQQPAHRGPSPGKACRHVQDLPFPGSVGCVGHAFGAHDRPQGPAWQWRRRRAEPSGTRRMGRLHEHEQRHAASTTRPAQTPVVIIDHRRNRCQDERADSGSGRDGMLSVSR